MNTQCIYTYIPLYECKFVGVMALLCVMQFPYHYRPRFGDARHKWVRQQKSAVICAGTSWTVYRNAVSASLHCLHPFKYSGGSTGAMGQNCEGGGSLVTPVHACSHMGTAVHPWEKPKNVKNLIISLALLELSKVSPQIAPLEVGMRPSAQTTCGHGGGEEALGVHPSKHCSNKKNV